MKDELKDNLFKEKMRIFFRSSDSLVFKRLGWSSRMKFPNHFFRRELHAKLPENQEVWSSEEDFQNILVVIDLGRNINTPRQIFISRRRIGKTPKRFTRNSSAFCFYRFNHTSGLSFCVSLRSWKWSTTLPEASLCTAPISSRGLTLLPFATDTEDRLQYTDI